MYKHGNFAEESVAAVGDKRFSQYTNASRFYLTFLDSTSKLIRSDNQWCRVVAVGLNGEWWEGSQHCLSVSTRFGRFSFHFYSLALAHSRCVENEGGSERRHTTRSRVNVNASVRYHHFFRLHSRNPAAFSAVTASPPVLDRSAAGLARLTLIFERDRRTRGLWVSFSSVVFFLFRWREKIHVRVFDGAWSDRYGTARLQRMY